MHGHNAKGVSNNLHSPGLFVVEKYLFTFEIPMSIGLHEENSARAKVSSQMRKKIEYL